MKPVTENAVHGLEIVAEDVEGSRDRRRIFVRGRSRNALSAPASAVSAATNPARRPAPRIAASVLQTAGSRSTTPRRVSMVGGTTLRAVVACASMLAAVGPLAVRTAAQTLDLPPRSGGWPGGREVAEELRDALLETREERLVAEVVRGNVPGWLRTWTRVGLSGTAGGVPHEAAVWVTPDYLAVGSDGDYLLVPLTPGSAQAVADRLGAVLPTPRLVDAVWSAAEVRLTPSPIPPGPQMTTMAVFRAHDVTVRSQRQRAGAPMGALVAGHKKDVVLVPGSASAPERVVIYGWHRPDGTPIQPVYGGHTADWVDYSHGVRLVSRRMLLDGVERDLVDVLSEPTLAPLLSEAAAIAEPRYPVPADMRCPDPGPIPPEWVEWDEGPYSLNQPPSFELVHRGGIDSETVSWSDGRSEVYGDYGRDSDTFEPGPLWDRTPLVLCQALTAETPRVSAFDRRGLAVLGAYWEGIPDPWYADGGRLALRGHGPLPADRRWCAR